MGERSPYRLFFNMKEEQEIYNINVLPPSPVLAKFDLEKPSGEKVSKVFELLPWAMDCDKWLQANFPGCDNVLDPVMKDKDFRPLMSAFIKLLSDDDLKWLFEHSGNNTAEELTDWLMSHGRESKIQVPVYHAVGETLAGSLPESKEGEGEGKKKALLSPWILFSLLSAAAFGFLSGKWGGLLLDRFLQFLNT